MNKKNNTIAIHTFSFSLLLIIACFFVQDAHAMGRHGGGVRLKDVSVSEVSSQPSEPSIDVEENELEYNEPGEELDYDEEDIYDTDDYDYASGDEYQSPNV